MRRLRRPGDASSQAAEPARRGVGFPPGAASKLFVAPLDDQELALLERALSKVIVDYSFG